MPAILYVEDDPICGRLVQEALADQQRVEVVRDGFSALDRARETRPDLLLVDLRLPTLNGFELIEKWRREPELASIPVIVITAQVMGGERERAENLGCAGFVEKPFSLSTLREAVATALAT